MKFAIADTEYLTKKGYNVESFRKSVDGTRSMVHYEFAEKLCSENKLNVYNHDDKEFEDLLASPEWTEPIDEELIEE